MRQLTRWLLALLVLLVAPTASADDLRSLVQRADLVFRGKTSAAVLEMDVKTKRYQRHFKIVAWDDSRDGDRTLIKILGPTSWRGHATLKIGDKLKLYNPKTNHVQVVGHSMLGSSWMGSHFSNDDLVKETRLARDYELKLGKKWTAPAPNGGEATFYRVEMTPKPSAPVAWGRIEYELWVKGDTIAPSLAKYFRKAGDSSAARTMTFGGVTELGGRIVPATMKVTLASKPGEHTLITYKKLKLNVDIPDNKFTEQAMRH